MGQLVGVVGMRREVFVVESAVAEPRGVFTKSFLALRNRKSAEFSKVEAENVVLSVDLYKANAEIEELKAILERSKVEAEENLKKGMKNVYQDYADDMTDQTIFAKG